ncbi:MAG: DUF2889 domain-containing protein [Burkholderiaceae bacterium]
MPLSPPAPRTDLHRRRMDFRGYRRDDGLFDIECTLLDTKGMDVPLLGVSRVVKAGEPMHDMSIRMRVNDDLEVIDIEASSDATPYAVCPDAVASLQTVKGMKIGAGWTYAIKRQLVGAASCTHLAEMLIAMGTAAYQTVVPYNRLNGKETPGFTLDKKVDSCYAYAAERPLIRHIISQAAKADR